MSSKINQIQEKIANLKEKQTELNAWQQNLIADLQQAEQALSAAIEEQKAEEARLTEEQRQQRQLLKQKVAARLEAAAKVDKAIAHLINNVKTFLDLAAEVESLADRTSQLNPSLTLEKAKLDVVDSIKEGANSLGIPTFFRHVPPADRKSFLEKEQTRLKILE
ncbi:MAG: hypothetical protein A4E53_03281 [Pelotomaculum sp. PtaB.Bin104]|nr:MAG: hypothetical protein A4E53_03281 [Pelotomaculum sp. PtaB.Bin104]